MRKIFLFALILLFACSCEKEMGQDVQKLLVGSWDVSYTYTFSDGTPYNESPYKKGTLTFLENGRGVDSYENTPIQTDFSYYYDKGNNAVVFEYGNTMIIADVESLSKDRFIFHTKGSISGGSKIYEILTTWNGKKIK